MKGSPPLRFLAVVIGGWAAARTALLAPIWPPPPAGAVAAAAIPSGTRPAPSGGLGNQPKPRGGRTVANNRAFLPAPLRPPVAPLPRPTPAFASPARAPIGGSPAPAVARAPLPPPLPRPVEPHGSELRGRWSLSAWAFVRQGDSESFAAGGQLGGSQAGARFAYRLNRAPDRQLALSLRLSTPLRRPAGAEAALGISWKPGRRLPVHILAERRQALGDEGRSAFAVTAYGGVGDVPLGPFRIDAYAQAGLVGARSRDSFGDGSLRLSLPLGDRFGLGAGAWAAAQPGLSRLDLGPQAALRLPVVGRAVTVAADWRLRVAGNAEPGSGPSVTIATDF